MNQFLKLGNNNQAIKIGLSMDKQSNLTTALPNVLDAKCARIQLLQSGVQCGF